LGKTADGKPASHERKKMQGQGLETGRKGVPRGLSQRQRGFLFGSSLQKNFDKRHEKNFEENGKWEEGGELAKVSLGALCVRQWLKVDEKKRGGDQGKRSNGRKMEKGKLRKLNTLETCFYSSENTPGGKD